MATLRSSIDWSGREVEGIILGFPAREFPDTDPPSGDYIWDHPGIPGDVIDLEGDIFAEEDA